jgi:hypothetical protein
VIRWTGIDRGGGARKVCDIRKVFSRVAGVWDQMQGVVELPQLHVFVLAQQQITATAYYESL